MRRLELVSVSGEVFPLDRDPYHAAPNVTLSGMPKVSVSSTGVIGGARKVSHRAHGTRDVPVGVVILADSEGEFDEAVSRLARAVDPVVGDVTVRFFRNDGSAREVVATYVDGFLNLPLVWSGTKETTAPLVFEAFEPYWRSTSEVEYDILATDFIGGGEPTSSNAAIDSNAAIPSNGFNETGFQYFEVDLAGDVEAWPRWDITGPALQLTAVNITTGKKWSYMNPLVTDRRFLMDTTPTVRQVTLDDANVFSSLSDDSELWPLVPGRNWVGLRVQEWDPAHSKMLLSWRERFLTC